MYGREPYRHKEQVCLLVIIATVMLLEIAPIIEAGTEGPLVTGHLTPRDTNGHQRSSEDRPSVTREGPDHLCLNEVYPDPDRDLNGDMVTDQMDEFIELYNPTAVTVNLSGYTVSDNQDAYGLGTVLLGPGEILALFRGTTGLVLSSDEAVTLRYPNGTVLDVLDYPSLKKGWTFQRSPDGGDRARTGRHPTPGGSNPVPSIVINEVMPDPEGSNSGEQWVELLNRGRSEELKDMVLTNNEALSYILPSFDIAPGERVLIAMGRCDALPPHPNMTRTLEASLTETLYSSGDDLELKDRDGSTLDYIAWGVSKHIEGPKGSLGSLSWDGKVWDAISGSMSDKGFPNPSAISNKSLSRSPDGTDTDRTIDLTTHMGFLGSSPGWENDIDPTILFGAVPDRIEIEKGGATTLSVMLSASFNMTGALELDQSLSNDNWTLVGPGGSEYMLGPGEVLEVDVSLSAPADLAMGHTCRLVLRAAWTSWEFLTSCLMIDLVIPSPELYLKDLYCTFEGVTAGMVPEGALIDVGGKLCGGGEVPCPEAAVSVSIFNTSSGPSAPSARVNSVVFKDLTVTSRRSFSFILDTLGLTGGTSLLLKIDPFDLIEESDEMNNEALWELTVYPAPSFQGQGSLRLSEVLWNTTVSGCFVCIDNTGSSPAELSGFMLGNGDTVASFPNDCWLGPEEKALVIWGEDAEGRIPAGSNLFRMDGKGLVGNRMTLSSGLPDLSRSGSLRLLTRWRVPVDEVLLHRGGGSGDGCLPLFGGPVETTYGTVLKRARALDGSFIDTNTTLDWTVEPMNAGIGALLISPKPGGSGEFLVIDGMDVDVDLSGACLSCRGRVAVLPNGTRTGRDGLISVSKDPDQFRSVQGVDPDLTTGWEVSSVSGTIPGCRVTGYEELLLPNDNAELLLLDRGNRLLDRVAWGTDDTIPIGKAPYDTVLWRSFPESGHTGPWRVLCRGTDPAYSLFGMGRGPITFDLSLGSLDLTEIADGDTTVQLYTPYLQEGDLLDLLLNVLGTGTEVEVFLGCQPWEDVGSSGVQASDGDSVLRACRAVSDSGGRLFAPGTASNPDQYTPFLVSGNRTVILYDHGRGPDNYDDPILPSVTLELGDNTFSLPALGWMMPDLEMVDITSILSSMPISLSEAGPVDVATSFETPATVLKGMSCTFRSQLDTIGGGPEKEVWVLHNGGPLDVVSLLDLAKEGSVVRLLLNPREVHPSSPGSEGEPASFNEVPSHKLDLDELERTVLEDSIRTVRSASEQGLDLEARVLPVECGLFDWSGLQVGSGTVQLELPSAGDGHRAALRLSGPGLSVFNEVMGSLWADSHQLPLEMGWGTPHRDVEGPSPTVRVQEVFPDTYLVDDPDEYVALMNTGGSAVDISGWTLSDDEGIGLSSDGTVMLPEGSVVGPGAMFFIARDHQCFLQQNGHIPDLSMHNCSLSDRVLICRGDMRLSNNGDTILLRDTTGTVVDSVIYGSSDPLPFGGSYSPAGSWSGPPAPLPGWGNILHREQRTYGGPSSDTGTREDWMGLRPRVPGQSRFGPFTECEVESISTGYCPDSGSDLLSSIIAGSGRSLDVNVYELTSEWVTSALTGAVARGVEVRVIMEGSPVGGRTYGSDLRVNELLLSGAKVRYMTMDISKGIRDRYSYDHAKYMVSDGRTVLISSDNLKDSSFPLPLLKGACSGTRGWVMLLESVPLSQQLAAVFEEDWNGPDMVDGRTVIGEMTAPEDGSAPSEDRRGEGLYIFGGSTVKESAKATLLISPDHISLEGNRLLQAIDGAEKEVLVEAMSMDIDYLTIGTNASKVREYHGLTIPGIAWPNPYVTALLEAAMRGVDIKVLLDGSDFDGDSVPDNQRTVDSLLEAAGELDMLDRFHVRLHPAERPDLERKIDFVHNKGMVIDSRMVWTSSFNIGPTSALKNREVGVLVTSEKVSELFRSVFMFDWGGTLLGEDLIRSVHYGPAGASRTKGVKVELTLNGGSMPEAGSELVIVPSLLWDRDGPMVDGRTMVGTDDINGTEVTLVLPDLDISEPNELDLYLLSGERWAHILRFKVEPFDKDAVYDQAPWYGNDLVPLLGSVVLAIAITAFLELFLRRSKRGKGPKKERKEEE